MRTVVITGAAGNLGRAVADAFRELGDNVVPLDAKTGTDLLDPKSIQAAIERHKRIDVLCNIAGGFRMGSPCTRRATRTGTFCSG